VRRYHAYIAPIADVAAPQKPAYREQRYHFASELGSDIKIKTIKTIAFKTIILLAFKKAAIYILKTNIKKPRKTAKNQENSRKTTTLLIINPARFG
jgi:hypothetical protein